MNDTINNQHRLLQMHYERLARWFLYIAGFTLFNSVMILFTKMGFGFAVGLGIVDLANLIAIQTNQQIMGIGCTLFFSAIYGAFGWFARSGNVIVFSIGMALYAIDMVIQIFIREWIGIAMHGYILYLLFNGLQQASSAKKAIAAQEAAYKAQRIANAYPGQGL